MTVPGGVPDYFETPNWANSPPLRKFVDNVAGLTAAGANNLGQYIPVAIPDTTTFPGSDYYEIELGEYAEQMHSDLPPTTLRGYHQINTADTVGVTDQFQSLPGAADRRPEGPAGAHQVHQSAAHGGRRQPLPPGGHHHHGVGAVSRSIMIP